ncbi:MAG: 30S ribosome-binding factor RbfA [Myxococcales bacterium]|nr:30S ribosome-binding factor RbfA [Myxococcales bacterium]
MAKRTFLRADRVASAIRNIAAEYFTWGVMDPALTEVAVTDVQVTPDLSYARIFYRIFGKNEAQPNVDEALRRFAGKFRSELAQRIRLRHVPDVVFIYDQQLEAALRIEEILAKLREEQSEDDSAAADETPEKR